MCNNEFEAKEDKTYPRITWNPGSIYVMNVEAIKCDNPLFQCSGKDKKFFYILFSKVL